jgi:tetratricopeptide (TPR) repeat protein
LLEKIYQGSLSLLDGLQTLERKDIIIKKKADLNLYSFKQILVQEAVYSSLLRKVRVEYHRKVANHLVSVNSSDINEIAHHYYEGKDYSNALPYLIKSGQRAAKTYANQEAIEIFNMAISIKDDSSDPALVNKIFSGLGRTYTFLGKYEEAQQVYNQLLDLGRQTGIISYEVNALNKLGSIKGAVLGNYEEAIILMEKAENLSKIHKFDIGLMENYLLKCTIDSAIGQFERNAEHLTKASKLGEKLNNKDGILYGKAHTALMYLFMTKFDESLDLALKTLELTEKFDNKFYKSELLSLAIPFSLLRNGKIKSAHDSSIEGLKIAEEIGNSQYIIYSCFTLLEITILTGEYQEALFYSKELTSASYNLGVPAWIALSLSISAKLSMILGKSPDETEKLFSDAFEFSQAPSGFYLNSKIWIDYGYYKLHKGDFQAAMEQFENVLNIPTTHMFLYKPVALLELSNCYIRLKNDKKAEEYLTQAESYIKDRKMRHYYPKLSLTKAKFWVLSNKEEEAINEFNTGEKLASELAFIPDLIDIKLGLAKFLKDMGKDSDYQLKQKEVDKLLNELANSIQDAELRNLYMNNSFLLQRL